MPMIKIIPLGNIKGLPEEADLVEVTKQHLVVNYQTKQRGRGGGVVNHRLNIPIDSVVYEITTVVAPEAQDDGDAEPEAPKRRGRPPKAVEAEPEAPKRRGRPPKVKDPEPEPADDEDDEEDVAPAPKRRGRPPKVREPEPEAEAEAEDDEDAEPEPPRRRGRPPKVKTDDEPAPRKRRAAVEPEDDEDFVDDFKPQKVGDKSSKRRQRPEEPKVKVGAARKPFTVSDDDDDGGWPDDE